MSYFSEFYSKLHYPFASDSVKGLRRAQLGALHASAAHFSLHSEPAIITMPTGSGKTAVLIASAYLLRANRVLVITPSRMVREQIAEQFSDLSLLKEIGAIEEDTPPPKVISVSKRVTSIKDWEAFRDADVIVASIPSISPVLEAVPDPPTNLFDLILVDEAHHSPARTWQGLLEHFSQTRKLLFTATPFRNDQREIRGRFIYTYSLKAARDDGIFGDIEFKPVKARPKLEESDIAIAKATEIQFNADREGGFKHLIMVRTDSHKRAKELEKLYQAGTNLRLQLITGQHSLAHIKKTIKRLSSDDLDGIICVDMLGEGFDFPNLKIAAVHSPHKSLAVTLQFIGRFARTKGSDIGKASFLAIPSEIEIETEQLYKSDATWQELISDLSAARVEKETKIRAAIESFTTDFQDSDFSDLSLYSLSPYYHIKIYHSDSTIDIRESISFPSGMIPLFSGFSDPYSSAIHITRQITKAKWTDDKRFNDVRNDLTIIHWHAESSLVFICSSMRTEGFYEHVIEQVSSGNHKVLPLSRLNRALNGLKDPVFYNVGMRNQTANSSAESYRIIAGSGADRAILPSDARLYHRGHCFGGAYDGEIAVTIGISSASKIWSSRTGTVPELIEWTDEIAKRINSNELIPTQSGLDFLSPGEELVQLPPNVMCAEWGQKTFIDPPMVTVKEIGKLPRKTQMLDFDLAVDASLSSAQVVAIIMTDAISKFHFEFCLNGDRLFNESSPNNPIISVERHRQNVPFISYINEHTLRFFTGDLGSFQGVSYHKSTTTPSPYNPEQFIQQDWTNTDITREFGSETSKGISIHKWMAGKLADDELLETIYYDHGSGEVADFITIEKTGDRGILVRMYHCKSSGAANAGERVSDIYEVCSQVVKSTVYAKTSILTRQLRHRYDNQKGAAKFLKGDLEQAIRILEDTPSSFTKFQMVAVQPGLAKNQIPERISIVIASANDHVVRGGFEPLIWFGS